MARAMSLIVAAQLKRPTVARKATTAPSTLYDLPGRRCRLSASMRVRLPQANQPERLAERQSACRLAHRFEYPLFGVEAQSSLVATAVGLSDEMDDVVGLEY